MKAPSVEILIPNYNGREALELCIESIDRYTPEPHRVFVHDDHSTAKEDHSNICRYLVDEKIHGAAFAVDHRGHGDALNNLLRFCEADYAAIIDNDIEITERGWLGELLAIAKSDPKILIVCDRKARGYYPRGFRPEMFLLWLGLINMKAYRDGMDVDWAQQEADRRAEPWASYFEALCPPEENEVFLLYKSQGGYEGFDRDKVIFDPGATLCAKMQFDNPKGYKSRALTDSIRKKFIHYSHAQAWLDPVNAGRPYEGQFYDRYKADIGEALKKLRRGK